MKKLVRVAAEELSGFHFRMLLARLLLAPFPIHSGGRLRVRILRAIGFTIGRGTVMWGTPTITGGATMYRNLTVGSGCWLNVNCLLDVGAPIFIGDNVAFGHEVMVLTTTHEIGGADRRATSLQKKPVTIGSGAWLGARCIILPGVTVGAGAIVAAGAIVTHDVPPNTMVAGMPAQIVKSLGTSSDFTST